MMHEHVELQGLSNSDPASPRSQACNRRKVAACNRVDILEWVIHNKCPLMVCSFHASLFFQNPKQVPAMPAGAMLHHAAQIRFPFHSALKKIKKVFPVDKWRPAMMEIQAIHVLPLEQQTHGNSLTLPWRWINGLPVQSLHRAAHLQCLVISA